MRFRIAGTDRFVEIDDPEVTIVGFSGRDRDKVRAHIEELSAHGIPAPSNIPEAWEISPQLVSQRPSITVNNGSTSGEAEPVLVFTEEGVFLSVGSDHTDRELERTSMQAAKEACTKVVATECWPLESVESRWDVLRLEADVTSTNGPVEYQASRLDYLLPLDWFLEQFEASRKAIVFCGTVPLLTELETEAESFTARLVDEFEGRILRCHYLISQEEPANS